MMKALQTFRGDSFTLNICDKNLGTDLGDIVTMTLRRKEDSEELCRASGRLKKGDCISLTFRPQDMEELEGNYKIDLELSNEERTFVHTFFVNDVQVRKDVTYNG